MHNFIYDEDQIRKFVSILSPLKEDEMYFVSMSARNKYLTDVERRYYELGRTEMFARELIKPSRRIEGGIVETYLRVLKSMQVSEGGYTSRTGKALPDNCLIVYANINPTSGLKAAKAFMSDMTEALFDMRTNPDAPSFFAHLDSKLMKHCQKEKGTRSLIDVDFDIPKEGLPILKCFLAEMEGHGVKYHVIETKSGYHVLLERETLKFNYNEQVATANYNATTEFGKEHVEVVVNKNGMVPVPGTMQAGHKVRFLEVL